MALVAHVWLDTACQPTDLSTTTDYSWGAWEKVLQLRTGKLGTTEHDSQNWLLTHSQHSCNHHVGLSISMKKDSMGELSLTSQQNAALLLCIPTCKTWSSSTVESTTFNPNSCMAALLRPGNRLPWVRGRAQTSKYRSCKMCWVSLFFFLIFLGACRWSKHSRHKPHKPVKPRRATTRKSSLKPDLLLAGSHD